MLCICFLTVATVRNVVFTLGFNKVLRVNILGIDVYFYTKTCLLYTYMCACKFGYQKPDQLLISTSFFKQNQLFDSLLKCA